MFVDQPGPSLCSRKAHTSIRRRGAGLPPISRRGRRRGRMRSRRSHKHPFRHIERKPQLDRPVFLNEGARLVQREILFAIDTQLIVIFETKGEPDDPVEFGGSELIAEFTVSEEIRIAVKNEPVFVQIKVHMRDITKERTAGVVGTGKITAVIKQPPESSIRIQVLMRKVLAPPGKILRAMQVAGRQDIGICLLEAALVDGSIALILNAPAPPIDKTGQGIGHIPLAEYDPPVRAIRKEILISVEGEVLLVEIDLEVGHVTHAHEAGVIGTRSKRWI